jgi:hypothetical protein
MSASYRQESARNQQLIAEAPIHLQQRSGRVPDPTLIDQPGRLAEAQRFIDGYVRFLKDAGWTKLVSDNEYRFKLLPAFRLAWRVLLGEFRAKRHLRAAAARRGGGYTGAPAELSLQIYKRFEAGVAESRPIHWAVKLALFAISAVVFLLYLVL